MIESLIGGVEEFGGTDYDSNKEGMEIELSSTGTLTSHSASLAKKTHSKRNREKSILGISL